MYLNEFIFVYVGVHVHVYKAGSQYLNNFHNIRSSKQRTNSPLIFKPVPSVSHMKYLYD